MLTAATTAEVLEPIVKFLPTLQIDRLFFVAFTASALSAIALYISFQGYHLSGIVSGFALIPLLAAIEKCPSRRTACGLGLLTGFAFYYIELYWITNSIAGFTSLPPIIVTFVMALLALYMGLYLALFCGVWHSLNSLPIFATPGGKIIAALAGAAIWILLEDLRALFLGGFPWHPLGLTQIDNPLFTWLLPLGGVRLLSGLIIIINIGIYLCGRALLQKRIRNAAFYGCTLLIPVIGLALSSIYFHQSLTLPPTTTNSSKQNAALHDENRSIRVALIQPNIPQKEKWRPENREKIINKMLSMSQQNLNFKPDLIIWPEAALPLLLEREPLIYNSLRRFTALNQTSLMLGSPRLISQPNTSEKKLFNSIFMISPSQPTQIYNKIKLVPYGEFTPLTTLFPFISKIVPGLDYSSGNELKNFDFKGLKIAPSVCFEGVFPAFTARFFAAGADILINLTNDAWFGDSPGPRQHLMNTRLRALENHCTICRCANTGISAIINPDGRIEQQLPLNQAGIITAEVTGKQKLTFYARHPHLPSILAGLYLLLPLFLIFTRRYKVA